MSLDVVAGQMADQVTAVPVSVSAGVADRHNLDPLGHGEQGQGIGNSAGGGASLVPGDEDGPELERSLAEGNDQHRSP